MDYFFLTIKHKWYVFLAGRKTGVPLWRLIKHDWSKFTLAEYPHYQRQFFGDKNCPGFPAAWLHHQNLNDHHWEYWVPRSGHTQDGRKRFNPIEMPWVCVREMVADWMAAGKAYQGEWPDKNRFQWLIDNQYDMNLHPITKSKIVYILKDLGFNLEFIEL